MNLQQITKKILNKTQYGGNKEPKVRAISASDFGNDLLQIYLRYKYGVPDNDMFGQDTIGSICHLGLQQILEDDYESEKKFNVIMDNGWSLTGSIDLLNVNNKEIIDIKVTKQYTVEKVLKDNDHQYIWQLSVYKYLVDRYYNSNFDIKLLFVLKDGGYDFRKMVIKPSLELLDIEPKSKEEVENRFYEITNALEQYIELDEYPQQCSDLWWRKTKNGSIPVRCEQYCSYKDKCPYYKVNPMKINF